MIFLQRLATLVLTLAIAAVVAAGAWWLFTNKPATPKAEKPTPAATVPKIVKEDELNTVVLTEEAEKRIGLATSPVVNKQVHRAHTYGGEVMVPTGRTIPVVAPLSGAVKAPASGLPSVGSVVKTGQVIFHLTPILTPDSRVNLLASLADATGQVNTAKANFDLAEIAFKRAERVLKEGAGSQRQVDEARAALDVAKKTLEMTTARQDILKKITGENKESDDELASRTQEKNKSDAVTSIPITAPENGILRAVSALPGQTVPSGAALFEVVDLSTVWLRVPIPIGDLDRIDQNANAEIGKLSESAPASQSIKAKRIVAPPSANALAATVDIFYELPNTHGKLSPGQRVGVTIPLASTQQSLAVPWSSIVFDIHGNNWVYVLTAPHTYTRKRVVVSFTSGTDAVLTNGPTVGSSVITQGAQELFGAETGFVK